MRPTTAATKNLCRMCNLRVAVGIQCAACDFWYHTTEKCSGDGCHGRPPFICDSCMAQLEIPAITHFASERYGSDVQRHQAMELALAPSNRRGVKKLRLRHSSPDASVGGSPVGRSVGDLRMLRRKSQLMSTRSLRAPTAIPHVSGAEVLFDEHSSSTSSRTSSSTSAHEKAPAPLADGLMVGDRSGQQNVDANSNRRAVGEYTYHTSYAPIHQPRGKSRVKRSGAGTAAVLQLIAPERREGIPSGLDGAGGAGSNFPVGGAGGGADDIIGGTSGVAGAFEDHEFDISSILKKSLVMAGNDAAGRTEAGGGKSATSDVATIILVEEFNSNAFGHRQGEQDSKQAQQRKAMLMHKLREKKVALKRRATALAAMRVGAAAAPEERLAARSTKHVLMAHRKMYYADVPQPLRVPWRLGGDGSSDSGEPQQLHDGSSDHAPDNGNKLQSTSSIRVKRDDAATAKALLSRTTNGLRISTVEEVTHGFKASSEEEDEDEGPEKDGCASGDFSGDLSGSMSRRHSAVTFDERKPSSRAGMRPF